ncbi:MAG: carboxypeptidase regulatory-like domain-containing protein, partial [Gammaproteobacteria bacterium]|nr:carboxypeptidase regulatory-like domain-containing protein [Gammaproteobacteria bacterium]
NLETAIKQCSEPVKIEVKEVPTKSKVIKGIVKTDQGVAVSGITVKFEYLVDGKEDSVSVVSDASGNYDIKIDKSVFNEVSETTYLIYAYKESYHPSTKTLKVGATDNYTVNFTINLIKTNEVVLEIEPKVHHLGDDNYNGSNNSQFQKKTEGVSFSKSFDISAAQYQNYAEASLSFQSKGIETGGNLSINGHDYNLSPSSSNGSYKTYTLAVEKSFYTEGSNNLKVTSDVSKGDYDDFEFSNIVLTLSGTGIIDTDKDGMPDDWEKQHSLDPNDSGDAIKDFDGDGISNLDEYKQGTDPKVANANIDVTVSVPVLTGEFQENSEYSVSVEVSNAGSATITFGNVDIYLSTDQSHSNDDKKLATFEFKQLASKTTQTLANLKMTLPIAGNYWFYADAKPLTGETNQDNNYSALRKITVRSKTANYQMVSIKSCTPATPDSVVSCTVQYNTSDG